MICVICGYEIIGFGNNALPVKDGKCCGACNDTVVIPKRLANVFGRSRNQDEDQTKITKPFSHEGAEG